MIYHIILSIKFFESTQWDYQPASMFRSSRIAIAQYFFFDVPLNRFLIILIDEVSDSLEDNTLMIEKKWTLKRIMLIL